MKNIRKKFNFKKGKYITVESKNPLKSSEYYVSCDNYYHRKRKTEVLKQINKILSSSNENYL